VHREDGGTSGDFKISKVLGSIGVNGGVHLNKMTPAVSEWFPSTGKQKSSQTERGVSDQNNRGEV